MYTASPTGSAMRVQLLSEKQFYLYLLTPIYNATDSKQVPLSCNMTAFSVGSKMYN